MAAPPPESAIHHGIESPHAKPRGVGAPQSHGNITDASHSVTLAQVGKEIRETRRTRQFTGKSHYAPTQAKSWVGVVTAQLRMVNLYEIYEDVKSYSGTHLAKIQDIINKEGGPQELKRYQVPVVKVRVPDLEIGTPAPRRNTCLDVSLDSKDVLAYQQRTYIGLGALNNRQSMMLPTVGSTVEIVCDNDYFYSHDGKYNGYFTKIITLNPTRALQVHSDCPPDSPKDKFDGKEKPQTKEETEAASANREPACTEKQQKRADKGNNAAASKCQGGWYSEGQPKGKDGQRAFGRGGLVDFAKDFWGSASKSYGGGVDSEGEALIGQERTQSLRSQKPSNQ